MSKSVINEGMINRFITAIITKLLLGRTKKVYGLIKDDPELKNRTDKLKKSIDDYKKYVEKNIDSFNLVKPFSSKELKDLVG